MTLHEGGKSVEVQFSDGHVAALRQMAFEVLNSPDLIKLSKST